MWKSEDTKDLYAVLGVLPTASIPEIRSAFRRNAIAYHRNSVLRIGDQLERMEHALEVLADPQRRKAYDAARRVPSPSTIEPFRREAKLRQEYALKRAHDARRLSEVATRSTGAVMRHLLDEHDWLEIEQAKAHRRRELISFVAKMVAASLVIGAAVYWWMNRGFLPALW